MVATKYLPKLDGLRAVSIFLVLVEHFLWNSQGAGALGVTIFFVISGYLITSILISYSSTMSLRDAAAKFYWRRSLRLFPIFYLCIAVTAAFNLNGMRQTWLVDSLYIMNFKVAFDGAWNGSSHFWSLAVEEQFYVAWFAVIMLVPRRLLLSAIASSVIAAIIFRVGTYASGATKFVDCLLPGAMDSLAIGGLISYLQLFLPESRSWKNLAHIRLPLIAMSFILVIVLQEWGSDFYQRVFARCADNLLAVGLIMAALDSGRDWKFDWLSNPLITHIGKISYGIYVYHNFLPHLIDAQTDFMWVHSWKGAQVMHFLVLSGLSVGIAEVSWRLVEKPILRLKDKSFILDHQVIIRVD